MSTNNLVTPAMLRALREQIMKEQFDEQYPVGKGHYVQYEGMEDPAVHFAKYGASWTLDTAYAGRVLVGQGSGYALGATGGEANHTLTTQEMPKHKHSFENGSTAIEVGSGNVWTAGHILLQSPGYYAGTSDFKDNFVNFMSTIMQQAGGGQSHNNMQPYKVVGVWKRTA